MQLEVVIGLEIHMKLKTATKMFCSCGNDAFGSEPNTSVCPICMGFPGTLPVVNKAAVASAVRFSLALQGDIQQYNKFDRKNYFYPDLPKGYQISQFDIPVSKNGQVEFLVDGELKEIRLNRLHMEEDAGKLIHERGSTYVDFNRAGTPLVEIVTEPDFRSAAEVTSFLRELQAIARYLQVANADMEKGEMRCDVNISLRPAGTTAYGTKVELKNMNSFSAVERAIAYETQRQTEFLERKERIVQETRGWDDAKGVSESQRSKEEAHDYRYFPEPDLPPLHITENEIEEYKQTLPELPTAKRQRYVEQLGLKEDDARLLAENKILDEYFQENYAATHDAKKSAAFAINQGYFALNPETHTSFVPAASGILLSKTIKGELSSTAVKEVIEELHRTERNFENKSIEKILDEIIVQKGLKQVSNVGAIEKVCQEVLAENEAMAADYRAGKTKVLGALVGQVMKKSGGKVNPTVVNEVLMRLLKV